MGTTTTRQAAENGLRWAVLRIDVTAVTARLRAVRCRNFDNRAAVPCKLVPELLDKHTPPRIKNASCETSIRANHVSDLKSLNDDDAVAIGITGAEPMSEMRALSSHLEVEDTNASLCPFAVLGPLLLARDIALRTRQALHRLAVVTRSLHDSPVAIRYRIHDTAVQRDNGGRTWCRRRNIDLVKQRHEPLRPFTTQCAGLRLAFDLAMDDGSQIAEFWKANSIAFQAPSLWVRFGEAEKITSLALPSRSIGELLEATLPRPIKIVKKLSANIPWNVREPWKRTTQLGQLIDLVESRRKASFVTRTCIACTTLFVRKIPEEAQRAFPCSDACNLRVGRIHAEAKGLANEHVWNHSLVCGSRNQFSYWSTCCARAYSALGLRSKVPQEGHHRAGICSPSVIVGSYVQRLRVRPSRVWIRGRPRPSARVVSTKSRAVNSCQFLEGCICTTLTSSGIPRNRAQALGCAFLESKLLRCVVRWRPIGDCQTIRRETERRERRFFRALKDVVSSPKAP